MLLIAGPFAKALPKLIPWKPFFPPFSSLTVFALWILCGLLDGFFRYIFQHHPEAEDAVLHGQPDYPMRGHLLPVGLSFLLASWFRGEDRPLHQHPSVADHVLLADIGNYTFDFAGSAPPGKISPLHHVVGRPERRHYDYHIKHSLSKAEHPQNAALDTGLLHQEAAQAAADACAQGFVAGFGGQQDQLRPQVQQNKVRTGPDGRDANELWRLQSGLPAKDAGTHGGRRMQWHAHDYGNKSVSSVKKIYNKYININI